MYVGIVYISCCTRSFFVASKRRKDLVTTASEHYDDDYDDDDQEQNMYVYERLVIMIIIIRIVYTIVYFGVCFVFILQFQDSVIYILRGQCKCQATMMHFYISSLSFTFLCPVFRTDTNYSHFLLLALGSTVQIITSFLNFSFISRTFNILFDIATTSGKFLPRLTRSHTVEMIGRRFYYCNHHSLDLVFSHRHSPPGLRISLFHLGS